MHRLAKLPNSCYTKNVSIVGRRCLGVEPRGRDGSHNSLCPRWHPDLPRRRAGAHDPACRRRLLRWLAAPRTTTFRFDHPLAAFTVRKERRPRGGAHWYVYRKRAGRVQKTYLGKAEDLTLQRLTAVAAALADQVAGTGAHRVSQDAAMHAHATDSQVSVLGSPLLITKLYLPPPARS
jgi:hypothetical protein